MIRPLTLGECDEQFLIIREKYLEAERRLDLFEAGRFYEQLDELFDIYQRLPKQRISPENGGPSCAPSSTG